MAIVAPAQPSLTSSIWGPKLVNTSPRLDISPRFPSALRVEAAKKIQGKVVCSSNDKTVSVEVFRIAPHPRYRKRVKTSKKYHAHDEDNACKVGDVVTLELCAPVSKTKKFKVVAINPIKDGTRGKPKEEAELPPFESTTEAVAV